MKNIVAYIILFNSLFIYLFHPNSYNRFYIVLCGGVFLLNIFIYYRTLKLKNYFNFDGIFFLTYFIATQYYPLFLHGTNLDRYFVFMYSFDDNLVSQASGLSLLGLSSYISGSLLYKQKNNKTSVLLEIKQKRKSYSSNGLFIMSLVSFGLFVVFGGYQRLFNLYRGVENLQNEVSLASYFFILCPALLFVGITIEFINIKSRHSKFSLKYFNKLGFFITILIIILILITGSRTIPLQLCLISIGLYSYFFRPIGLKKFVLTMIVGIVVLFGIVVARGAIVGDGALVFSDIIADLFGTNRAIFIAIEYTNKFGYTYGENMLSGLLSPIPFAQNFFINVLEFDKDMMGSSSLYTKYTLGSVDTLGLGTNIVADIYFSFGFIGIVLFMFSLGRFIRKISVLGNYNYYTMISYVVMLSYAVFLVRAEFFTFLRFLIWSIIIMFFTIRFKRII